MRVSRDIQAGSGGAAECPTIPQVHRPSGLSPANNQRRELFFLTACPTRGRSPGHLCVTPLPPICSRWNSLQDDLHLSFPKPHRKAPATPFVPRTRTGCLLAALLLGSRRRVPGPRPRGKRVLPPQTPSLRQAFRGLFLFGVSSLSDHRLQVRSSRNVSAWGWSSRERPGAAGPVPVPGGPRLAGSVLPRASPSRPDPWRWERGPGLSPALGSARTLWGLSMTFK